MSVLFRTHEPAVRGVVASYVQDHSMRQDIVQEAWLRAFRYSSEAQVNGHFVPWIHRIVRNMAVNHHRLQGRFVPDVPEGAYDSRLYESMHLRQAFTSIMHAVSHLPKDLQIALLLVHYSGLTPKQASVRQHVTASTVRSRVTRAIEQVRHHVGRAPCVHEVILPVEYVPHALDASGHMRDAYMRHEVRSEYASWRLTHEVRHECITSWSLTNE